MSLRQGSRLETKLVSLLWFLNSERDEGRRLFPLFVASRDPIISLSKPVPSITTFLELPTSARLNTRSSPNPLFVPFPPRAVSHPSSLSLRFSSSRKLIRHFLLLLLLPLS